MIGSHRRYTVTHSQVQSTSRTIGLVVYTVIF